MTKKNIYMYKKLKSHQSKSMKNKWPAVYYQAYNSNVSSNLSVINNQFPAIIIDDDKNKWDRHAARNRAYRKLKGKVPPGWKLRVSHKRKRYFINGKSVQPLNQSLNESKYFVTATKYMGARGSNGFPYIKCFLHPTEGFTWSLSNWSDIGKFHECANVMLKTSTEEMEQVHACMEALRDMMSEEPLCEVRGIARSKEIQPWNNG